MIHSATASQHAAPTVCCVRCAAANGALGAFFFMNWRLSRCHESFLAQPASAIAARTRTLIRSKLPDHPVLAPFLPEEDERIGRGEVAGEGQLLTSLPPPPPLGT